MPANRVKFMLPASFPGDDYTPFGYVDNPAHTAVLNPSGVLRTVPPMGLGYWLRALPFPYSTSVARKLNYLSFLRLTLVIDGVAFHTSADFQRNGVRLVSRYHTKTLLSYDWEFRGMQVSAKYALSNENALLCLLEIGNSDAAQHDCMVHVINDYGYPHERYWGSDGVRSSYAAKDDVGISKFWAYGDIFVVGADRACVAYKATPFEDELSDWVRRNDLRSNDGALIQFSPEIFTDQPSRFEPPATPDDQLLRDHLSTVLTYSLSVSPGDADSLLICLARGVNEVAALETYHMALRGAAVEVNQQLIADAAFYAQAALLSGDFPASWKHGWVYDLETIRMTIRPPVGMFRHPWDGMQVHTPRSVLGEAALDALCLSYGDIGLAKAVMYGTFADAPMANVPCTREDGSMNMISENGSECGTGPNWGFPFFVIQSLYGRDPDIYWLGQIFPYLERFIDWWMQNRSDSEGWFHADCSWESGQDGSKRFQISGDRPGGSAIDVRTVDIEAAVAHAMQVMTIFARLLNLPASEARWSALAQDRLQRVRSMYVDGYFRDFDARTGTPILMEDYFDIMLLSPLTLGLATPEQIAGVKDKFAYFQANPLFWLEWPSFMFPFTEAAWNSDLRLFSGQVVADTANRIYSRTDAQTPNYATGAFSIDVTGLPPQYNYRMPGVANEFWPVSIEDMDNPGGCENYGWGATLPTLIVRNVIGFREAPMFDPNRFTLAPALPSEFLAAGKRYGCDNLRFAHGTARVSYTVQDRDTLTANLELSLTTRCAVTVRDAAGAVVSTSAQEYTHELTFAAGNGQVYSVEVHMVAP